MADTKKKAAAESKKVAHDPDAFLLDRDKPKAVKKVDLDADPTVKAGKFVKDTFQSDKKLPLALVQGEEEK